MAQEIAKKEEEEYLEQLNQINDLPELLLGDDKDTVLKGVKESVVDKNIICDYESDLELNSIEKEKEKEKKLS